VHLISEIRDIIYPTSVSPDIPFEIEYNAVNLYNIDQILWGYILDINSGQNIVGTNWFQSVSANGYHHSVTSFEGISATLNIQIVIGHVQMERPEICTWIDSKGGPDNLSIIDVFEAIDAFIFDIPLNESPPTLQEIIGIIDYFLGFNGDISTRCNYYEV
jgi:hypothetical protein